MLGVCDSCRTERKNLDSKYQFSESFSSNFLVQVRHRYNDFVDLDKKLKNMASQVMDKIKLPGKKAVGNQDPDFIQTRRKKLHEYLVQIADHDALVNSPSFKTFITDPKFVLANSYVDADDFKRKQQEKYLSQLSPEDETIQPQQNPQPVDYSNFDFSQLHQRFSYASSHSNRDSAQDDEAFTNNSSNSSYPSKRMYDDDLEELASSLASIPRPSTPRNST